jgi:hypothetical protein
LRIRRELVVCVLMLAWTHRAAASEEDVVVEQASTDMSCSELQLVREAHRYYVVGCGQRRTYECASNKCVTIEATQRPAAPRKPTASNASIDPDGSCVGTNVALGMGCLCLSAIGRTTPGPLPDTCR